MNPEILPPKKIKIIKIKGKGRGVVAIKKIKKGEVIEVCPIIFLSEKETEFIDNKSDILKFYYLEKTVYKKCCLMFGYGSIYNHSANPNADVDYNEKKMEDRLTFFALKDIKIGEEIVYDYEFDDNIVEFLEQ